MSSSGFEITGFVRDVQDFANQNNYLLMTDKVKSLTKYLFSTPDFIYTNLNEELGRSCVFRVLMESMVKLNDQWKRDILRFFNLFLKTNKDLRNEMTCWTNFVQLLLNKLDHEEDWHSIQNVKYHINIASYLLFNVEVQRQYETRSICRIVGKIIKLFHPDDTYNKRIPYVMFYASAEINTNKTSIRPSLEHYDRVITKDMINAFVELIRDYLHDFQEFYSDSTKKKYLKYILKVQYSFDEICQCLSYYGKHSQKLRHDIYQSGLYELLSLIFLITNVPDIFLLSAIDLLSLPYHDVRLKEQFQSEHQGIIQKMKTALSNIYPKNDILKEELRNLLYKYDCQAQESSPSSSSLSSSSPSSLIYQSGLLKNRSEISQVSVNCSSFDLENWLTINNLDHFREKLSLLSPKGINQIKMLTKEKNGRFQLIELLMSKLGMDFIHVLEFLGALESLNFN